MRKRACVRVFVRARTFKIGMGHRKETVQYLYRRPRKKRQETIGEKIKEKTEGIGADLVCLFLFSVRPPNTPCFFIVSLCTCRSVQTASKTLACPFDLARRVSQNHKTDQTHYNSKAPRPKPPKPRSRSPRLAPCPNSYTLYTYKPTRCAPRSLHQTKHTTPGRPAGPSPPWPPRGAS